MRPVSARRYNPQIPSQLDQIILKVLSKEPTQRYRSADQLGRVLRTILQRPESYASTMVSMPASSSSQTRPLAQTRSNSQPVQIYTAPPTVPVLQPFPDRSEEHDDHALDIDWLTILIGLLAAVAVGGLIPFWLYIYLSINPPGR
jgi:serine/threonine-protein kinase